MGRSHFFLTLATAKIFNSAENLLCCTILIISISLWCKCLLPNSDSLPSSMSFLALLQNKLLYFDMTDTTCFILDYVDILPSSCFNKSCPDLAKFTTPLSSVLGHLLMPAHLFVLLSMYFQVVIRRMDY